MADEDTGNWFTELFFDDDDAPSAKEREMVMSPPPAEPDLKRLEGESPLDHSLRIRKLKFDYKKLMEDREMNPSNYMVSPAAAEAEPTPEVSRYNRARQLEESEKQVGTQ